MCIQVRQNKFGLVVKRWRFGFIVSLLILAGNAICHAEAIDWTHYCIDGVQLTGNYDAHYCNADMPVSAAVSGRPDAEVRLLFDGKNDKTLKWRPEETAEITVDLKRQCLMTGIDIIITEGGSRTWNLAVSPDGKLWHALSDKRMIARKEQIFAGSLAAVARYLRIRSEPGGTGVSMNEIYVYGEKEPGTGVIGGIYPSEYPPVANESVELRAVARNTTGLPLKNLKVIFEQDAPAKGVLGETLIEQIDARSATVASIVWTPEVTEPHIIKVRVSAEGLPREQAASKIIPVVDRRIYLTGWNPLDNERLIHNNLYNNCAGTEYYMAKLHGRTSLFPLEGPCVTRGESADYWKAKWGEALSRADCDGIAMDEWATINTGGEAEPGAKEALKRICEQYKGKKIIAPWLIGNMDEPGSKTYQNCDIILSELYINIAGHNAYRRLTDSMIDSFRKWGFLDRSVPVLGSLMCVFSTHEELEREIRYIRYRGPEIPGIGFYGYDRLGDYSRFVDELGYKYFIAPVVMVKQPLMIEGQKVAVTVWNIGGMNAHNVRFEALNRHDKILGNASSELLTAGQQKQVVLNLSEGEEHPLIRLLPGEGYTVLDPPRQLEVLPRRQAQGGPLQVYWELEPARISEDRIEFLKESSREVAHQIKNDGSWMLKGATTVSTTPLPPGRYLVRVVDGKTGKDRTPMDQVEIVPSLGRFFVTGVDGKPWKGDPQSISVKTGDTFEVSWNFEGKEVSNPSIYLSAPGEPLMAIYQPNRPYAMAKISNLRGLMKMPAGEPMLAGQWTWPTSPQPKDLLKNGGWLAQRGAPGDPKEDSRINMSANPGVWKLWIGTDFGVRPDGNNYTTPPASFGAVPITPVVTVKVVP